MSTWSYIPLLDGFSIERFQIRRTWCSPVGKVEIFTNWSSEFAASVDSVSWPKGEEYMEQLWQIHVATLTNPCNNRRSWCWQSWNFDKLVFRFRCKPSLGQLATAEESKAGARLRQQTAPFYDYNQSTTKYNQIQSKCNQKATKYNKKKNSTAHQSQGQISKCPP